MPTATSKPFIHLSASNCRFDSQLGFNIVPFELSRLLEYWLSKPNRSPVRGTGPEKLSLPNHRGELMAWAPPSGVTAWYDKLPRRRAPHAQVLSAESSTPRASTFCPD